MSSKETLDAIILIEMQCGGNKMDPCPHQQHHNALPARSISWKSYKQPWGYSLASTITRSIVMDCFIWGYLKQKIWNVPRTQQPQNTADLQASIIKKCANVPGDVIERAFDAMVERCQQFLCQNKIF